MVGACYLFVGDPGSKPVTCGFQNFFFIYYFFEGKEFGPAIGLGLSLENKDKGGKLYDGLGLETTENRNKKNGINKTFNHDGDDRELISNN